MCSRPVALIPLTIRPFTDETPLRSAIQKSPQKFGFALDLKVFFMTFATVFKQEGIYVEESAEEQDGEDGEDECAKDAPTSPEAPIEHQGSVR